MDEKCVPAPATSVDCLDESAGSQVELINDSSSASTAEILSASDAKASTTLRSGCPLHRSISNCPLAMAASGCSNRRGLELSPSYRPSAALVCIQMTAS